MKDSRGNSPSTTSALSRWGKSLAEMFRTGSIALICLTLRGRGTWKASKLSSKGGSHKMSFLETLLAGLENRSATLCISAFLPWRKVKLFWHTSLQRYGWVCRSHFTVYDAVKRALLEYQTTMARAWLSEGRYLSLTDDWYVDQLRQGRNDGCR